MKPYAFGIDIGGTKIEILKIEREGHVLEKLRVETEVQRGSLSIIQSIIEAVKSLYGKEGPPLGIGLGVAGQIEKETGTVIFGPNLQWKNVPLGEILRKSLNVKVFVINDVRAATFGEMIYGAAQGATNLLAMFIGTGIGGCIILDGKIVSGIGNSAGEIGHMIVDIKGPSCTCGSKGCLEAIAGGWGMEASAKRAVDEDPIKAKTILSLAGGDPQAIKGHMIHLAAKEKDPLALSILKEAHLALIAGTTSLINLVNPSVIIFGGGIIDKHPEMVEEIESGVRKKALKAALKGLEFRISSLKGDAGALGAAAYVFKN